MSFLAKPFFILLGMRYFTKAGYERAEPYFKEFQRMDGKVCLVTGANQGIGFEAALGLAKLGAKVYVVCRNQERGLKAVEEIKEKTGNPNVYCRVCDISSLGSINTLASDFLKSGENLHILINNAGIMVNEGKSVDNYEVNFATNTLGSYAITRAFEHLLRKNNARVIFVSSGGSLTERLVLDDFEGNSIPRDNNFGVIQYARDKRRQTAMSEGFALEGLNSYSMHPGWANTEALRNSMPDFHKKFESSLRTAEQGADTIVWLASCDGKEILENGGFYLDRSVNSKHLFLGGTGYSDKDRTELMNKLEILAKPAVTSL